MKLHMHAGARSLAPPILRDLGPPVRPVGANDPTRWPGQQDFMARVAGRPKVKGPLEAEGPVSYGVNGVF